jgi:hypothetical protein
LAARNAEIARLKGLKGRPDIRPSGMEPGDKAPAGPSFGARHAGANGVCTQIGNQDFTWSGTTTSKSRLNFLGLRAGHADYVINDVALAYLRERGLAAPLIAGLANDAVRHFANSAAWTAHLDRFGIHGLEASLGPARIATEGAPWGSIAAHGLLRDAVILSDDAGQFDVGQHALCWVHAERLVHRLDTFTDDQHAAQQHLRALIWWFYADLNAYRVGPSAKRAARPLRSHLPPPHGVRNARPAARRLHERKPDLRVLDRPELPLHTNGSENDIRCQVIKRKISGATQSTAGCDCRDAFLGLAKTCAKLSVSPWDYLGHRLSVPGTTSAPALPDLVRLRAIA